MLELGPPLVVDPERLLEQAPRWDSQRFRAANWAYRMLNMLRWNMSEAILEIAPVEWKKLPPERVQEKVRALNLAVANVLASMPYAIASLAGDIARLSPVPEEAEAATFALSGFVDAHISRDRVHRHNKALTSSEQLGFLPGSVREAWEERPPEEPIYRNPHKRGTNLVSRVETLLGKLGDEAAEKPENVSGRLDPQLDIPLAAQFSAREAAHRELNALKEKAVLAGYGLTEREDAVLELHEIEGYTHAEIADQRNISEGTSQADLKRALIKLRRAAG